MKKSISLLWLIGTLSSATPAHAEVFIPAGTEMESLNPGPPTFGVAGLETFVDSSGGNGFRFTQDTSCSLGNQYLSANTLNQAYNAACHEAAGTFLGQNADGSITIGKGNSKVTITNEGIADASGAGLIRNVNGAIHIGENSLITVEEDGRQKLYATDANGKPIDIDITNGSRLLINGRDVEKASTMSEHCRQQSDLCLH